MGSGICSAAFCESAALRGSRLAPLSGLPALPKGEPRALPGAFSLHLMFCNGANGVRPLRHRYAMPPLPKGEARALPETSLLYLTL